MRARLTKDFTFESAQTLPKAPAGHKCRRMHGHSFKVEVSIEGEVDPNVGWVYDHAKISDAMKPLLKMLDHTYLNDIEGLEKMAKRKRRVRHYLDEYLLKNGNVIYLAGEGRLVNLASAEGQSRIGYGGHCVAVN